jgi:hypothetical protein
MVRLKKGHSHIGTPHTIIHEPLLQDETVSVPRADTYADIPDQTL